MAITIKQKKAIIELIEVKKELNLNSFSDTINFLIGFYKKNK